MSGVSPHDSQRHVPPREVVHWRNGVVVAYTASGLAFASWVARIPAIRDSLHLTPGSVGLLLLCMTVGSFASVTVSGLVVLRLGSRRTIKAGSAVLGAGLLLAGFGATVLGSVAAVGVGLAVIGLGTASWNTASNVEGAAVERALKRHIMPRLHGSFSAGTVAGAGLSALAAGLQVPVLWHFLATAVVVVASVWAGSRFFRADAWSPPVSYAEPASVPSGGIPGSQSDINIDPATGPIRLVPAGTPTDSPAAGNSKVLDGRQRVAAAWRERRTLLIGLLVLGLTLAEGSAGDWVALALADGYGATNATGALGYGIFVTAMMLGRFAGTIVLDRWGRVAVLRVCAALAFAGLALFVFAPSQQLAMLALVAWGLGASLGFPVGMSAAADDPEKAAARVSVVSTIGYGAFLCGPPLLGLLAEHVGVLHSLLAVLVLLAVSFFLTPVVRRPEQAPASSAVRGG
ncbi:MFS transporter [Paeniglutamicibacter antarcticus]|uniref:MFS transporter n=1 Tax=Arthrobacter terrae TaxID=2935737 RepID=A0A931CJX3_9MICC|nr:MFS transporter [Arthrobacter terrae]MBG0739957.1 MFS transporter [Arthrobacter terrae]